MAIFIIVIAYYCVRNTTQDLIYAITGRVPPSFIREQNRIARREARRPITDDRGHRKFFRNAYNDAWETAEAHRARWARKRTKKRHAKWGEKDGMPTPIETNARPEEKAAAPAADAPATPAQPAVPPPVVHDVDTFVVGGKEETLYQRFAMRRRNGGQPMTTIAIADELGTTVTEAEKLLAAWTARYEQETNPGQPPKHLLEYQKHSRCRDCNGEITLDKDPRRPGQWIVGVKHTHDDCPQDAKRHTPQEQQFGEAPDTMPQPLHEQILEEDQDRRDRRESLVGLFGEAFVAFGEYEQEERQRKYARDSFARWFNQFSAKKPELTPEQIDAEYTKGRRLAAVAGITDVDAAREVLAKDDTATPRQAHDRQVEALANAAAQNSRGDARPSGSSSPDTKENSDVTTETTGLQSGLAYNDEMAKTCEQGAASVEQSIAALENGEVGQGVTGPMQQGREHLEAAMACFQEAKGQLEQHLTVQEAYSANPDAGNKQFVTAE